MNGIVRVQEADVVSRLAELDLSRETLISIVKACAAGYGGCTDNDPPNARGFETWRWGVRRAREELRPAGWEKDDSGNYSTVVNHNRQIRLAIMNADDGAGMPDRVPLNRAKKGPNSEKVATRNDQLSFPGAEFWPVPEADELKKNIETYSTWHLCVHINGDIVRAELALLNGFSNGFFNDFVEKIIVIGEGDWNNVGFKTGPDDDFGPELDFEIARK